MGLHHVALPVVDLDKAHYFYAELLGLKRLWDFVLKAQEAKVIYDLEQDLHFVTYGCEDRPCLELYSAAGLPVSAGAGRHFCFWVRDRDRLLERLKQHRWPWRTLVREGRTIVFVKDRDGHLLELKPYENTVETS